MNLRLGDMQACYERWRSKGAEFVTPPIDRGAEIRCYMRWEVLAYLAAGSYNQARAAAADKLDGTEYWVGVTRHFMSAIVAFEPLRRFVREETPLAFRVLTMRGSIVQATVVRLTTQMLEEAQRRGAPALRAPAADLAYAMTKVGEGFIYSDPVANVKPDVETAIGIMRLLLE